MPTIEATVQCEVHNSFRVQQVAGMFGLKVDGQNKETFVVDVPDVQESWRIGAIVGPSGSGKSTVARCAFGEAVFDRHAWPAERAMIDCLGERPVKEVTQTLTAVGFGSPPAWLRPYHVLSNGEQFRADLARALLAETPLLVFDEFTSVVDRTVAKTGSAALARALRRGQLDKRFVAVTCHYDVLEWLEPDWVVDMAQLELQRRRLRRPEIRLRIVPCHHSAWRLFRRHHYLSHSVNKASHCYLALWGQRPVAFCAVLAMPGRRGRWRISRIVVLPDFQGIGIATRFLDAIAEQYASESKRVNITTSHPAMIASLRRSGRWRQVGVKKTGHCVQRGARTGVLNSYVKSVSQGRAVVSLEYLKAAACGGR